MPKIAKPRTGGTAPLIAEYRALLKEIGIKPTEDLSDKQLLLLVGALITEADWTKSGATEMVYVARQYGHFFLRNAYALARALEVEDGLIGI